MARVEIKFSLKCSIIKHDLDVYYNPKYNGLHVVHSRNGNEAVIGGCCEFYDDAYTNILRHIIPKKLLRTWIKLDKTNLSAYDFLDRYDINGDYHIRVSVGRNNETHAFYSSNDIIKNYDVRGNNF